MEVLQHLATQHRKRALRLLQAFGNKAKPFTARLGDPSVVVQVEESDSKLDEPRRGVSLAECPRNRPAHRGVRARPTSDGSSWRRRLKAERPQRSQARLWSPASPVRVVLVVQLR